MAFSSSVTGPKCWFLVAALIFIAVSYCKSDIPDQDIPDQDIPDQHIPDQHIPDHNVPEAGPAEIVAKALLCFNNNYIYSSCEEAHRLTESGNINVHSQETDEYCNGPCLEETTLVLDCVGGILNNFEFYNKATIQDVRATLSEGCGYGSERGNFNVAEHIQDEESDEYNHAYSDRSHLMRPYLPVSMIIFFAFLF